MLVPLIGVFCDAMSEVNKNKSLYKGYTGHEKRYTSLVKIFGRI